MKCGIEDEAGVSIPAAFVDAIDRIDPVQECRFHDLLGELCYVFARDSNKCPHTLNIHMEGASIEFEFLDGERGDTNAPSS